MILSNFSQIPQEYLVHLPEDNYPILDTFEFVSIGLGAIAGLVGYVNAM